MSIYVAVVVSMVLAGDAEDAPADFDLCTGVDCALGMACEVAADGVATQCVEVVLGEGEKCASEDGTLGSCRSGSCKVESGRPDGYCSAAGDEDSSSGTNLLWLWILLPILGIACVAGGVYKMRSASADLGYGDFLRQYEQLEMRRVMLEGGDVEAPPTVEPSLKL